MIPVSEDRIKEQVKLLYDSITSRLTPEESATFEVRKSVTHGDIEILLNGRLYYLTAKNLNDVLSASALESRILEDIFPRLRGKKYHFSNQEVSYDLEQVQNEINWVLRRIIDASFDELDRQKIYFESENRINELLGKEEYKNNKSAKAFLSNRLFIQTVVKYLRRKNKNG